MIALPGRLILVVDFFLFITLNVLCHSFLICQAYTEKSGESLLGVPLYITSYFPLAAFKILSLNFVILIITCLDIAPFQLISFGTLCTFCIWMSISFPRLDKFSAIISSKIISAPFFSLLLLGPL